MTHAAQSRDEAPLADQLTRLTYYRGRVALAELLGAIGVGRGDDVVIQAFTCLAVPEGVMAAGARPVYADLEVNAVTMSARSLAERITPRTRAIVVQHTFGIPADLGAILDVAQQHRVPVLEDCCHSIVSRYDGRRVGGFGRGAFYSFEWGKPLPCGVGGAAVTTDRAVAAVLAQRYASFRSPDRSRRLRLELQYLAFTTAYRPAFYWPIKRTFHWMSRRGLAEGNYNPVDASTEVADDFHLRMSPATARRVARAARDIESRAAWSRRLEQRYRGIAGPGVVHPTRPASADVVFNRYPLLVERKARLLEMAEASGVEVSSWYDTPIHPLGGDGLRAVGYEPGSCPEAERAARRIVSLPTNLTTSDSYVQDALTLFRTFAGESTGGR